MTLEEVVAEKHVESKAEAEALIPQFQFQRVLNQDQNGRRITLLGTIQSKPALLTLERAAFPSDSSVVGQFTKELTNITNLGANDVYRWYMSNHVPSHQPQVVRQADTKSNPSETILTAPDLKVNLIYPASQTHIKKYTAQKLRYVTETASVYQHHLVPWIERTQRTPARLDWIYNILDRITEQQDVIYRTAEDFDTSERKGFLLLPDLNWDRKTVEGLHLLAIVERRDLWSFRGLKKEDIPWLKKVRNTAVREAAKFGKKLASVGDGGDMEEDMLKCYVHYQPTYYHFHIHIVHVMLEPDGNTQSVGKAFGLENLISQLENMAGDGKAGLDQVNISYFVGDQSDLWKKCFAELKEDRDVDLNSDSTTT